LPPILGNPKEEITKMTEEKKELTPQPEVDTQDTKGEAEITPEPEAETQTQDNEVLRRLQQMEENYKKSQREISKREQETQRLKQMLEDRSEDRELLELAIASIAELRGESEGDLESSVKSRVPELLQEAKKRREEREARRQQEEAIRIGEQYRQRVEALGLTPRNKEYRELYSYVRDGNFEFADAMLTELEEKVPANTKTDETKETEEQRIARMVQEQLAEELKRAGLGQTDVNQPSGAAVGEEKFLEEYSRNPTPSPADDKRASEIIRRMTGGK
jgi:hypothetical protein